MENGKCSFLFSPSPFLLFFPRPCSASLFLLKWRDTTKSICYTVASSHPTHYGEHHHMKRIRIIFALIFVLALTLAAAAQGNQTVPPGEPKLVIESFTHDFGEVKAGTPLSYSFIVK